MTHPTALHQLGRFVVMFQNLEAAINELIYNMTDFAHDPAIEKLTFARRLDMTDKLFSEFVDAKGASEQQAKDQFHALIIRLKALTERRNVLIHSRYARWLNVEGREGLLRMSTKITSSKRVHDNEEELQPEAFDGDLERLQAASEDLHRFRMRVIDWLYPTD